MMIDHLDLRLSKTLYLKRLLDPFRMIEPLNN